MPTRNCICGKKVEIPKIIHNSPKEVKCPRCGATADLKVKRRNRRVKGLKGGFVAKNLYIKLR